MPEYLNQPKQPIKEGYHGYYATDEACPLTIDQLKLVQTNPELQNFQRTNLNLEKLEDGAIIELFGYHHLAHYVLRKEGNVVSIWHSPNCGSIDVPLKKFNSSVEGQGKDMHDVDGLIVGNGRSFPYFNYGQNDEGKMVTKEPDEFWFDNLRDIRVLKNGEEGIL